jgi:hypothetical protein
MGAPRSANVVGKTAADGASLALGWIQDHLDEFAVSQRVDLSAPNLKDNLAQLKPVSELALTLSLLHRCNLGNEGTRSMAEWIWRQIHQGKILTRLLMARHDFLPCCSLYASLYQLGYRAPHLDGVLGILARSQMARALPLPPWGALALEYSLFHLDLADPPDPRDFALYTRALPEPWVISGEIGYAITHEAFYLTDFGFRQASDTEVVEYLKLWVPYWARVFVAERDFDLASEFAIVWRCLHLQCPSGIEDPMDAILLAQTDEGYVEGPEGAGAILHRRDDTKERRTFLGRYHTTLVALMACALDVGLPPAATL